MKYLYSIKIPKHAEEEIVKRIEDCVLSAHTAWTEYAYSAVNSFTRNFTYNSSSFTPPFEGITRITEDQKPIVYLDISLLHSMVSRNFLGSEPYSFELVKAQFLNRFGLPVVELDTSYFALIPEFSSPRIVAAFNALVSRIELGTGENTDRMVKLEQPGPRMIEL